jgi:N-formylglutamate amidohydrolase
MTAAALSRPAIMIDRHNFSTDLPNLVSGTTPVMSVSKAVVSHCSQNRLDKAATVSVDIKSDYDAHNARA